MPATNCYAGCTYVSQVFALTLGLAGPQGSPTEQAVWAHAMDWWAANATKGLAEHFGGGIISLKYSLPLLDAHGNTGLALKMHMQTDRASIPPACTHARTHARRALTVNRFPHISY